MFSLYITSPPYVQLASALTETFAAYRENARKHISTFCGQIAEF
jgi:hypothetical protein